MERPKSGLTVQWRCFKPKTAEKAAVAAARSKRDRRFFFFNIFYEFIEIGIRSEDGYRKKPRRFVSIAHLSVPAWFWRKTAEGTRMANVFSGRLAVGDGKRVFLFF